MRILLQKCIPLAVALSSASIISSQAQCRLNIDWAQWEEVARDDFNGTTLNTDDWMTHPDSPDLYAGWGSEWYDSSDPSLVTVSGGAAHIKAKQWRDPVTNTPMALQHGDRLLRYRSGILFSKGIDCTTDPCTNGKFRVEGYGMWEARLKLPVENAWPTFWLNSCPTDITLLDGVNTDNGGLQPGLLSGVMDNRLQNRIDCGISADDNAELPSIRPYSGGRAKLWSPNRYATMLSDEYHTYTVVWTPEKVTIFLDGREIRTVPKSVVTTVGRTKSNVFYSNIIIAMQMYAWNNEEITPVMDVDYVRILKPIRRAVDGQRNYLVPTSSYKTSNEFINHDISVMGIEPQAQPRPGISNLHSDAASISINANNPNQVFYRGQDEKLYLAENLSGEWAVTQLPSPSSGEVAGDVIYMPGLNYVIYKSTSGTIKAYYYSTSGWQSTELTSAGGTLVSPAAGSIAVQNSTNRIFYVGTDQQMHYCDANGPVGNYWSDNIIANTAGFANVDGNLVVEQGTGSVFYRGADNRIQYYWKNGSAYNHAFVDAYWNTSAYTVSGEPKSLAIGSSGVLYYIGQTDHQIHRFFYNGAAHRWDPEALPSGYSYAQNGAEFAHGGIDINSDESRITYLGYDGRIQGLYKDASGWHHTWLDGYWNTGEFLSFNNGMSGHSSLVTTGNLTAYYCGRDNHLRYFTWEPCERLDDYNTWNSNGNDLTLHRGTGNSQSAATSTAAKVAEEQRLVVLPNPTNGQAEVRLTAPAGTGPVLYTVSSMLGRVVQQGSLANGYAQIELVAQEPGIYLIRVQEGRNVHVAKLVKY